MCLVLVIHALKVAFDGLLQVSQIGTRIVGVYKISRWHSFEVIEDDMGVVQLVQLRNDRFGIITRKR